MTLTDVTVRFPVCLLVMAVLAATPSAYADVTTRAARETSEYILHKFGKTAAKETAETLSRRIATNAARHGPAVIDACRQVGPKALHLVEQASAHSPQLGASAARLLAKNGEHAA